MAKKTTRRIGLRELLRPQYLYLLDVCREISSLASTIRRQASLLINVHLNRTDIIPQFPSIDQQSFFNFAQGKFLAEYAPENVDNSPERRQLDDTYQTYFDQYFTDDAGADKISNLSAQIRAYNSRTMIANFKSHFNRNFFKFQYRAVRAEVSSLLPDDMEQRRKAQVEKSISQFLCQGINRLIFVHNASNIWSQVQNNSGVLPIIYGPIWDELHLVQVEIQQENPVLEATAPPIEDLTEVEDDDFEIEESHDILWDNDDSDEDDDDDDEHSDAATVVADNEPLPQRQSLGQRLATTYLGDHQNEIIVRHRNALSVLLLVDHSEDRRSRFLRSKHLKNPEVTLQPRLSYLRFLRQILATHNARRFQLFPIYQIVSKYFHIDEMILRQLCNKRIERDRKGNIALRQTRPPNDPLQVEENIWQRVFNLRRIGLRQVPENLSVETDGYGACVSFSITTAANNDAPNDVQNNVRGGRRGRQRTARRRGRGRRTARQNDELIDVTDRNKGMLKLTRIEHNSLRQRIHGHDVIGVDPGLKSVITAVRSEDPSDKLEISAGLWKQHRLDAAFQREEAKIRRKWGVVQVLTELSGSPRDDLEGWRAYLAIYYRNFHLLHRWGKDGFYRRWRRTREIRIQSLYANVKNALLSPGSRLKAQGEAQHHHQYTGPIQENDRPVIAWGSGNFGHRKGSAPMPNKGLASYISRFALVIKIPERCTSLTCPCGRRTTQLQVNNATICTHKKRTLYYGQIPGRSWKRRKKHCIVMEDNTVFAHPFSICPERVMISIPVIRHRVCPYCSAEFQTGILEHGEQIWQQFLENKCHSRRHDHLAVWNKDTMAALNMRSILVHYAATGTRPAWNLPQDV